MLIKTIQRNKQDRIIFIPKFIFILILKLPLSHIIYLSHNIYYVYKINIIQCYLLFFLQNAIN